MYDGTVDAAFALPQAVCGSCQKPVGEKRYQCNDCTSEYALCESCYREGRKSHVPGGNHVFVEIGAATRLAIHVVNDVEQSGMKRLHSLHYANCDICKNPINGNLRHKCLICPDFDLCPNCLENFRDRHDLSHPFIGFGVSKQWIVRCMAFTESIGGVPTVVPSTPHAPQARSGQQDIPAVHEAACNSCRKSIVGCRHMCISCPGKWLLPCPHSSIASRCSNFQILICARIVSRKTMYMTYLNFSLTGGSSGESPLSTRCIAS